MQSQMKMSITLVLFLLTIALMNMSLTNGHPMSQQQKPLGIQGDPSVVAATKGKETQPSKNNPSSSSINGKNNDNSKIAGEGDTASASSQLEQYSNSIRNPLNKAEAASAVGVMTQRARRSYKLPGNLDLSQFYTPPVASAEDGNEMMTEKELEYEREKFRRLFSILQAAQTAGGSQAGEEGLYGNAAMEPVINLMSNHPSRVRTRSRHNKPNSEDSYSSRQNDDGRDWLDDPIPISRHRVIRRTNNEAGGDEDEYNGFFDFYNPTQMHKRVPELMDNGKDRKTRVYSLSQLFSKAQRQDTRYPLRHRFLL